MSRIIGCLLCITLLVGTVYAGGKSDADDVRVKDPASWQEKVDINDKTPGKYNFYIKADDLGGNVQVAGPFNMYIDPESDKPVISITNPRLEMRVPGNLNIVGTCVDDDAVASVELVFDGDAENPVTAAGKDFWSYYLDTRKLSEGSHTITVTGIDVNGLRGRPQTVKWNLDRKKPATGVENYTLGALVAGKVNLTGTVMDGNGIDALWFSVDGGTTFEPVNVARDNKANASRFQVSVDTTKMQDGPAVIWFRARDMQGSVGIYSFLFYVDNTKPVVRIIYPDETKAVNGKFTVAGYAGDAVEIASLAWKLGKETGTFDITLGNPWWVKEFDITGQTMKDVELEIIATDTSGNVTSAVRKIAVDAEGDKPIVMLASPAAGGVLEDGNSIHLSGMARDDDGVQTVLCSVDGGAAVEYGTDGVFRQEIEGLADGAHSVTVWARDINGIEGPKVIVAGITCTGKAPEITINSVKTGSANAPFVTGMEIHPESGATIECSVASGSALESATWQFGGMAESSVSFKKGAITGGTQTVSFPVTEDIPYGPVMLTLKAKDIHGRESSAMTMVYITDLSHTRGEPGLEFPDVRIAEDRTVTLDAAYPFTGYFVGGNVVKARLEPASKIATLSVEGNYLSIKPTGTPGLDKNVMVVVETDKKQTYKTLPFNFETKGQTLELAIADLSLREGDGDITVTGTVKGDLPATSCAWRLIVPGGTKDGAASGTFTPSGNGSFTVKVEAGVIPAGPSIIEIEAGNSSLVRHASVPVMRALATLAEGAKPVAPTVSFVEGKALYYFVSGTVPLTSSIVTVDGAATVDTVYPAVGAINPENLATGSHAIAVKVADEAKKTSTGAAKYTILPPPAKIRLESIASLPWKNGVEVSLPKAGIKGSLLIAIVESASPVTDSTWSVGSQTGLKGAIRNLEPAKYEISLPIPAGLVADRTPVAVSASVKDGQPVKASGEFVVIRPKAPESVNAKEGFTWINGRQREDKTYILARGEILYGFYNGRPLASATFEKASSGLSVGIENGRVAVRADAEGSYAPGRLILTDVDGWVYRAEATSFLGDFDEPVIEISEPANGKWVQGSVRVKAEIKEKNKLANVEYTLDFGANWTKLDAGTRTIDRTIDLSAQPEGLMGLGIRVRDEAGQIGETFVGIRKDTVPPDSAVVVPEQGQKVNGEIRTGIAIIEDGKLVKAEYQKESAKAAKNGDEEWQPLDGTSFVTFMVGTREKPLDTKMKVRLTDASGNVTVRDEWPFKIDQTTDLPVTEIHLPEENEVVTSDFVVSGVVYDDDRPVKIWYRIDNNREVELAAANGYSIPVLLKDLTDNEHSVTVYAEDFYGVKGKPVTRKFRVSLEEPKAEVVKPSYDTTNKGMVEISGNASDKNGIDRLQVSIDNGNTFNDAIGTESWKYSFDTKIIQDGTHVVFVKVWDKYGIEGLYSSLINIDNTAPNIALELPLDGAKTVGPLFVSGQTTDKIHLSKLTVSIRSLTGNSVPKDLASMEILPDAILAKAVDISGLSDGLYNIDVTGEDAAGNVTRVSRNVSLDKKLERNRVETLYPLNGQHVQGNFNLYGQIFATDKVETVTLYVDGSAVDTVKVTPTGYYGFALSGEKISAGTHVISVKGEFSGNGTISSKNLTVVYDPNGQWVSIDSMIMGDFAFERPWLNGKAGYVVSDADKAALSDKNTPREARDAIIAKKLSSMQISFDNGRTFKPVELKGDSWRYHIETQDMPEGYHFMIVRANMADGSAAINRTIIQIDKTKPTIRLISPGEGGLYNQNLEFSGLASDDISLASVDYALRKGDKAAYEVPGFIQGLYFDAHFWGATLFDVGAGLTFFDDNVKLQFQYGQFTDQQYAMFSSDEKRFGGNVFGFKLLANVLYLPMSYFFGPDWTWLSANFALGANFSLFSETQSGKPQALSAVIAQLEFPRMTVPKQKMFRTYSFYTELQLWMISTDVSSEKATVSSFVPHITGGVRINVF